MGDDRYPKIAWHAIKREETQRESDKLGKKGYRRF
jgi:hypothetical protein